MLGKVLLVLLATPSLGARKGQQGVLSTHLDAFHSWAHEHGKIYRTHREFDRAFNNYVSNEGVIASLNANPEDLAEYGHTRFSDLTPEEFVATYFPALMMTPEEGRRGMQVLDVTRTGNLPESFDWRTYNAVSVVKDQSSCGSCWAESAVENVESVVHLASGRNASGLPTPLSVEQVIECDPHDYACYGGYPRTAFQYILEQGGLATEESYPYIVDGKVICLANQTFNESCGDGICDDPPLTNYCDVTCSASEHDLLYNISSYASLPTDEDALAEFLVTRNPISVAIDASGKWGALLPWLQFYKKGVANPKDCSNTRLDHAVLLVGFGQDNGTPYWTIKNSWGSKWGENGYFRMLRGKGTCGVNTMASTSIA